MQLLLLWRAINVSIATIWPQSDTLALFRYFSCKGRSNRAVAVATAYNEARHRCLPCDSIEGLGVRSSMWASKWLVSQHVITKETWRLPTRLGVAEQIHALKGFTTI